MGIHHISPQIHQTTEIFSFVSTDAIVPFYDFICQHSVFKYDKNEKHRQRCGALYAWDIVNVDEFYVLLACLSNVI